MNTIDVAPRVRWREKTTAPADRASDLVGRSSAIILRYGLALLVLWFGVFKFNPTEAQAIQPLLANSPFLSWLYALTDVRGASRIIGVTEIVIALLIAARPFSVRAAAIGGIGATMMFLTTVSFLATTPGSWGVVDGLVVPTGAGGFLIKDLILLGAALSITAEALSSREYRH